MALLGGFREGIDKVRFHLKADRQLAPQTVQIEVAFAGGPFIPLPVVADANTDLISNNEFKNSPDLDLIDEDLGVATVKYGAVSINGKSALRQETIKVISSYGRNYGEDYGNGL